MADPLTAIGSAASILQLVETLSKGLRSLRDTVTAIKDAPAVVQHIEEKVQRLEYCFKLVVNLMKQRSSGITDELELHRVIRDVTANCFSSLSVLQDKLPSRNAQNIVQAFHLWIDDRAIKQALKHIDEYTKYLSLLIGTLNLLKLDNVDKTLCWIADVLQETAQPRQLSQDAVLLEDDRKALESVRRVRAFVNNTATAFVSYKAVGLTSLSKPRSIAQSSTSDPGVTIAVTPGPRRTRKRIEVDNELLENRKILTSLKAFGLFEGAIWVQRRAFIIKDELSVDHRVPFQDNEKQAMKEELAEILVKCRTESSKEEALSILQELLNLELSKLRDANDDISLPVSSPTSIRFHQGNLSLHHKLGQLYKDTGQVDRAMENLRIVFDAYADETPKDTQKIKQVGDQLLQLYEYRVELGCLEQRGVFISQLRGFQTELEDLTGRPLEHRLQCDAALDWCQDEGIMVPKVNQEYRFDIINDDGSSPLHYAAQRCQREDVVSQMLENSITLEEQDEDGETPLLAAVGASNVTALSLLLQKGGSLNARDHQHQTPLHRSQKSGVTKLLLQHRLRRASTATVERDSSSSSKGIASPGSPAPGQDLDINAQDANKKTALYIACARGQEMTVKFLLSAGADPNIARHNHSPLAAAIESTSTLYQENPQRQVNVVAALISKGAEPEAVRNLSILRKPNGKFKKIKKALEGRAGSLPLSPSDKTLEVWESSSDRFSGEQSSLSSTSATGIRLDLPDLGQAMLADLIALTNDPSDQEGSKLRLDT
ncbi:hypothetical protein VMCG_04779 [Cytospora schulzeri]|uniref:Uncharacterized protein n=1 Tax=Cytospora schulzeri TaxID=448051 RepID=A0A423WN74_9PEZI|nr:hypothetical protein VMCG_04779 [Valsa malicola]